MVVVKIVGSEEIMVVLLLNHIIKTREILTQIIMKTIELDTRVLLLSGVGQLPEEVAVEMEMAGK